MKIAYLILAHNAPGHLGRLIASLSSSSSCCFIHIDDKSSLEDFAGLEGSNVRFTRERVPVYWGDFSQVEAILVLLRTALADRAGFDRFVLLSGADYPLRSTSYIERFFSENSGKEFMNLVAMPSEVAGKPLSRLTSYKVRSGDRLASGISRKLLMRAGILPRTRDYKAWLRELVPYGGSTWWALSREACQHIVDFADREIGIVDFFRNTVCPDESFFQTILGNSAFKPGIVRNLTYTDWSAALASPAFITEEHLAGFQARSSFDPDGVYGGGEMLFARKFSDASQGLVEKLEKQLRESPTAQ